jgi:splicing factor U2AF subunit
MYDGIAIRVRRPNDYNPVVAASLGPSQPSPGLNLSALGLAPGGNAADGPDRVFVGGLPYYLNEPQVRELLEAFGPLRALDIIRDKDTGNSKGYAFCVYADSALTDMACAGLNGMAFGDKTLTVRRASAMGQPKVDAPVALLAAQQAAAMQLLAAGGMSAALPGMVDLSAMGGGATAAFFPPPAAPEPAPTHVLVLDNVVSVDELRDDTEFGEIEEDMRDECGKHGEVVALRIPRPPADAAEAPPPGVGRVYVRYAAPEQAARARAALHGRKFGGNAVVAAYFDEERFEAGEL